MMCVVCCWSSASPKPRRLRKMQPSLNPLEWNCLLFQSNKTFQGGGVLGVRESSICGGEILDFHNYSADKVLLSMLAWIWEHDCCHAVLLLSLSEVTRSLSPSNTHSFSHTKLL